MAPKLTTAKIFFNQFFTLGLYFFFWSHRLGSELNTALKRKVVPTLWWFIVPCGGLYWMWRMTEALELATGRRIKQVETFLMYVLLSGAGLYGAAYFPDFEHSSGEPTEVPTKAFITFAIVITVLFFIILVALHAVFMAILQSKLNQTRGIK